MFRIQLLLLFLCIFAPRSQSIQKTVTLCNFRMASRDHSGRKEKGPKQLPPELKEQEISRCGSDKWDILDTCGTYSSWFTLRAHHIEVVSSLRRRCSGDCKTLDSRGFVRVFPARLTEGKAL